MKKAIALVLALFIAASVPACGSTRQGSSAAPSLSVSTSSAVNTPAATNSAASTSAAASTTASAASSTPSSESEPTGDQKADAAAELTGLLASIQKNVTTDTTGSYMTAVRSAVALLNWGVGTEMTNEEIRGTVIDWMMPKGNDESVDFANKLRTVDEAYKVLLGDHAKDLLSSAGCEDATYPWSNQAVERIETVMTAVGLR